ncbi:MAG TPA: hypothetical protein VGM16_02215 [Gammaproteobacteria bacterium]|jgi:hypothetical protein
MRSLSPNELDELIGRWYRPQELKDLTKWDPEVVYHDIYGTADVILRRRDDEEGGSARATLRINHEISSEWPAGERITYMLKAALEVLGDDRSRERFKEELAMTLGGRAAKV